MSLEGISYEDTELGSARVLTAIDFVYYGGKQYENVDPVIIEN